MLRVLDAAVEALLTALLIVLVLVGGAQIVWRFVLGDPLSWVIEASVLLMVWATMLAGYVGVRRNVHLSADFAGFQARPRVRWWLDLASLLLCIVFVVVYGVSSFTVIDAMEGIPFTALPIGQPALYWSLPAGALLMALALAERVVRHLRQGRGA
ncbi:TRAP transporter small permease subunit [Ramlibacter henchirensis]|uniref:TRAP transporter small permease protein n=1 Tax=Ramlibacter henchirensis TaxID=204072 RepID=A0A4Z0C380_9BURK|nr:TRAP transporter small permease subunit [Ramlibacter henchirensis]TFZ06026.1 TRAP transporter small permease subunit [Ramlibacter henchirensis]